MLPCDRREFSEGDFGRDGYLPPRIPLCRISAKKSLHRNLKLFWTPCSTFVFSGVMELVAHNVNRAWCTSFSGQGVKEVAVPPFSSFFSLGLALRPQGMSHYWMEGNRTSASDSAVSKKNSFPWDVMEKSKQTFWPGQYFLYTQKHLKWQTACYV